MAKLADVTIRNWIKSGERFEGRGDGEGLYLRYRKTDGVPRWNFRYQISGKASVLHLGSFAVLSLSDARKTAKEMRARVALGFDVAAEKKDRKRDARVRIDASVGQSRSHSSLTNTSRSASSADGSIRTSFAAV